MCYSEEGVTDYEGNFSEGRAHGHGTLYWEDGSKR